jgi:hypothetical protein
MKKETLNPRSATTGKEVTTKPLRRNGRFSHRRWKMPVPMFVSLRKTLKSNLNERGTNENTAFGEFLYSECDTRIPPAVSFGYD